MINTVLYKTGNVQGCW